MANIGIDIDGVLRNLGQFQLKYGKKYFKNYDEKNIDETKIEIKDIFKCTESESKKFWIKHIFKYCLNEPMVNNAADIINLLQKNGNKIHIITQHVHTLRQDFIGKLFRIMLNRFLNKNGVKPDSINYCENFGNPNDKLSVCKKLGIDYMIEDDSINIKAISSYCKVICIKNKYNDNLAINDNILKVDSFSDVYYCIKNFGKIKNGEKIRNLTLFTEKYEKNYNLSRNIGTPLFKCFFKPTILHSEFIPEEGPILLCGNHLHVWDQFPVICATDRITHWMSKKEYFDSKLGSFFKQTGAICVDRYGNPNDATEEALNYLEIGSAIGIFPEGTRNGLKNDKIKDLYKYVNSFFMNYETFKKEIRDINPLASHIIFLEKLFNEKRISRDDFLLSLYNSREMLNDMLNNNIISTEEMNDAELLPFKFGAVSMAKKSNALIVPFGVTGDYKIGNKNLTVNFGEPFKVEDDLEASNKILRQKILKLVQENRQKDKK